MRGKRSKQYRKLMQQYGLHFGFRVPYQVLLDAAILQDAKGFKMDFLKGLEKTLHGEVKPMITQCCMRHLYDAENKDEDLINHAKAFERRRCGHHELEKPLSTLECLSSVVDPKSSRTNKNCYVVASQDDTVRATMRRIPGVPLIYLKRSVMIMEPMAGATEKVREKEERDKFRAGLTGRRGAPAAKRMRENDEEDNERRLADVGNRMAGNVIGGEGLEDGDEAQPAKKKRKKGPSGPNPMSVKKKKIAPEQPAKKSTKPTSPTDGATENVQSQSAVLVESQEAGSNEAPKKKRVRKHKSSAKDIVPVVDDAATVLVDSP